MNDNGARSCWGVTARAVMGFAGIMFLVWLVGGAETVSMVSAGAG